jgi:hypothetical protein
MFEQRTLPGFDECISSPESLAGNTPWNLQAGPPSGSAGPAPAPANRFRVPVNAEARKTNGTCGRNSTVSSASVALQSSLASRLRAKMDLNGSMEYRLTWKNSATRSGRVIYRLRAKARRTSDSDSSGLPLANWATPTSHDGTHGARGAENSKKRGSRCLQTEAKFAGWPTPKQLDATSNVERADARMEREGRATASNLPTAAELAGWASPASTVWGGTAEQHLARKKAANEKGSKMGVVLSNLQVQVEGFLGSSQSLSPAETASSVASALNPAMSRWLQGFPKTWDSLSPNYDAWLAVQETIARADSRGMATP